MSFYDDASLIVYPSGYKEDKIYSLKPTNGTGDLTFSRASSATRVNAEGLIEEASVLGSELVTNGDFATDSNWNKETGWTISGGNANYNGSAALSAFYQNAVTSGVKYRVSFDVLNYVSGSFKLHLSDGQAAGSSPLITDNGNYVFDITSIGALVLFRNVTSFIGSIDNVSVKEVITSNVPRIDYTGGGCGSLLLEKQSTNLITYSEDFSNAYWAKSNTTVTSGFTSPDGTANAFKLVDNSVNTTHKVRTPFNLTAGNQYTLSVFAKKGEKNWIYLNDTVTSFVYFDLENGVIGTIQNADNYSITEFGDGWYKCTMTTTASAGARFAVYLADADNGGAYSGNGTDGAYIYGAQLEQSTYPTSYIISNSGTTTTRIADAASKTGISSLIGQTEGVLYAEIANISENNNVTVSISINDGSVSNAISLYYFSTGGVYYDVFNSAGTRSGNTSMTKPQQAQNNKIALKYKSGDIALWVNGIEADSNSGTLSLSGLNQVDFHYGDGSVPFYGNVQNLMVFPSALTDDELSDLTGAVHQTFNSLATFYGYTIL